MQTLLHLGALVEKLAAALPQHNLDGDEQEEYSSELLRIETQSYYDQPNMAIVEEAICSLKRIVEESRRKLPE
jgi:hypothetical protein